MLRRRLIPVLLLENHRLVKTRGFLRPRYIGDPINVVRIFNDKEVDEIVVLDIAATPAGRGPDLAFLQKVSSEAFMPLCYGGGITSLEEMRALFRIGIEKVALCTAAMASPSLVRAAASEFGSQSIVVAIDVKRRYFGRYAAYTMSGRLKSGMDPVAAARLFAEAGAGELFLNSIDRDGMRSGYDLPLIRRVIDSVDVPVIVCGGADGEQDFRQAWALGASACAAGTTFVFQSGTGAVLVSYPDVNKELLP